MSWTYAGIGFPFECSVGVEAVNGSAVAIITGIGQIYFFGVGIHGDAIERCQSCFVGNESGFGDFACIQVDGMVAICIRVGFIAILRCIRISGISDNTQIGNGDIQRVGNNVVFRIYDVKIGGYINVVSARTYLEGAFAVTSQAEQVYVYGNVTGYCKIV